MRYTKSALGLLNAQYRSVLKKCFLINMGLFALSAPALADDFSLNAADLTTVKDSAVAINWIERPSPAGNVDDHVITVEVSPDKKQYFEYDYPTSGPTTTHQNYSGKSDETITDSYVDISEGTTGGAIVIGNADNVTFNADFVKNSSTAGLGGAVDVISTGENGVNFKGNFIANSATGSGGAIWNEENGKIGEIEGDFIANHADITDSRLSIYAGGGAIDNDGSIGKISGNFINNYVQSTRLADDPIKIDAQGGAIVGWTTDITKSGIDIIQASFIRNKVLSENGVAAGGAIASATIGNVNKQGALLDGDFSYNQAISTNEIAQGGAIYNSNISEILGYFKGNQAISNAGQAYGGAIYYSTIGKITDDGKVLGGIEGNFENNLAHANRSAFGGAIHNGTISKIIGNFIKNQAISTGDAAGGAIYVSYIGRITDDGNVLGGIEGNFENNQAQGGINTEGGAIYDSNISKIIGDFTGNQAVSEGEKADGGAISTSVIGKITNDGKVLGGIEGSFKNNLAESKSAYTSESSGGAINLGIISKIVGDFDSNVVKATNRAAGGAISNATIGEIIGNLNKNQAIITGYGVNSNSTVLGGAIYNSTIGKILDDGTVVGGINGNFENNSIDAVNDASGGAIDNSTISQITGNFVGNIASVRDNEVLGGAIHKSTIGKITDDGKVLGGINGNFENNEAQVQVGGTASASGGAISEGTISQISGNFSGNKVISTGNMAQGGAIYNAVIGEITADGKVLGGINSNFENNSAQGNEAFGGAIYGGTISQITGNFSGNQTISSSAYSDGGAIYGGTISHIIGNFTGNKAISQTDDSHGGAIANSKIGSITNDGKVLGGIEGIFENNVSQAEAYAWGGAIDNSNISQITGDFVGNQAVSLGEGFDSHGGAITDSIIGKITDDGTALGGINGNFNNNIAQGTEIAFGGAIYNSTISQITGNFIENKAVASNGTASGGAINSVTIGKILDDGTVAGGINGNFENNLAQGTTDVYGGAIHVGTISSIHGNFSGNKATTTNGTAQGGAIMNITTNEIVGDFAQNSAVGKISAGGAIYNSDSNSIGSLTGNFNDNSAVSDGLAQGGAIFNQSKIDSISGNFTNNHASSAEFASYGGAILNTGEIGKISNAVFSGNYVEGVTNEAGAVTDGGAVWNAGKITFEGNNVFKDNYKIVDGNKEANDIYNAGAIYVAENGSLDISGGISGNKDAPSSVINIGEGGLLQIHDATVSDNTIYMNADSTLALDVTNFGGSSDEQTGGKIDGNIVLNADSTLKVSTYNVFGEDEGESTYQFATNVDTNNGEWKLDTKVENLLYNYDGPVLNDENNTLTLKYKKKTAEEVADAFGTDMEMSEEILAWSSPKADDNNQFNRISDEINRRAQQGDKSLVNDMSDLHENTQGNLDVARYFGDLVSKNVTEHLNSREGEDLWAYKYGLSGGDAVQRNAQVWVDALFSSAENSGDLDYSADTTGVIAAVEGKPTQNLLVGAGYAYQQTDMDSGSKSSDIDTHSVFGYGEYSWRQWFVNALVSYNMSSFDQTKKAFGESISSDFDTDVLGAQLLVGQNLGSCNGETLLRIRPQAGVRYYKISQDGYKDSAGVQYGDIDSDVITGVAGVEVVVDTEINNTQVEPKAFVNATYDFQNDDATTVIKLPNGNGYTISQSANGKFGIETGVGIDVKMNDRATVGAMYQYDWRDDYSAHTGLLNVKYAF